MKILLVPGYTNAGPDHWMTHLQKKCSQTLRVEQDNWEKPSSDTWVQRLNEYIENVDEDLVLLGHSCGAICIMQWVARYHSDKIKRVILVAPADIEAEDAPDDIRLQGSIPNCHSPYNTTVIYSDNDPYLSAHRAEELAALWYADTVIINNAGHINTASGYGEWPFMEDYINGHVLGESINASF
ncbi:RBBP9/YdeN family alpha/beta hydrolase [Aeromonas veronii]